MNEQYSYVPDYQDGTRIISRLKPILVACSEKGLPVLSGRLIPEWIKGATARTMSGGDLTSTRIYKFLFGMGDHNPQIVRELRLLSRITQINNLTDALDRSSGINPLKDERRRQALQKLRTLV